MGDYFKTQVYGYQAICDDYSAFDDIDPASNTDQNVALVKIKAMWANYICKRAS